MSHAFDPNGRLVVVPTVLTGPAGTHQFRFAVDTGSTRTAVAGHVLEWLGYREPPVADRRRARTGSGETRAGLVPVARLQSLGRTRTDFPSLWLSIPPGVMLDGLLGLAFFRGHVLTLDSVRGRVSLRTPKSRWRFWA